MSSDSIGLMETSVRQRGARRRSKPTSVTPSAANILGDQGRGRAKLASEPRSPAPGLAHIDIGEAQAEPMGADIARTKPKAVPTSPPVGAGAKAEPEPNAATPRSPIASIVNNLADLQATRSWMIKAQQACDRRVESFIASELGFSVERDEKHRKAVFAMAKKVRADIEKKGEIPSGIAFKGTSAAIIARLVAVNAATRMEWDRIRAETEDAMIADAKNLPVWPFVKTIAGFAEKGLAVITGEAGIPIGDYRTVSGLWKRMGLAVIDGKSQRRVAGKRATDADRKRLAYVPRRRAECWTFADSLLRAQMCSELRAIREAIMLRPAALAACEEAGIDIEKVKKVDEDLAQILNDHGIIAEAHATGPYGEVYLRRKQHTTPKIAATAHLPDKSGEALNPAKWTPLRCHRDAARVMFKELLKDLWVEWRRIERLSVAAE